MWVRQTAYPFELHSSRLWSSYQIIDYTYISVNALAYYSKKRNYMIKVLKHFVNKAYPLQLHSSRLWSSYQIIDYTYISVNALAYYSKENKKSN